MRFVDQKHHHQYENMTPSPSPPTLPLPLPGLLATTRATGGPAGCVSIQFELDATIRTELFKQFEEELGAVRTRLAALDSSPRNFSGLHARSMHGQRR